jgi:CBS domain-containing protein
MPVIKVTPGTPVQSAVDLLLKHNISGVPVVDHDGQLLGMFSETDHFSGEPVSGSCPLVSDVMSVDVVSVDVNAALVEVAQAFQNHSVHRLAVTQDGAVVGVIGCRDLVNFVRKMEQQLEQLEPILSHAEVASVDVDVWCNID